MRTSLLVGTILALAPALSVQQPLTARDVVQRIQQNIGVPWTEPTVDTFKDGDPATPVTGIALTMMATFDVLQCAAARGANLVITDEPTFFDHFDKLDVLEAEHDSVTAAKRAFIRDHRIVVVRMHDHWHRRRPEPMATDVRSMQMALKDKGFDPGPTDGVMGPRTRAALMDYQKKEGLTPTGRWDSETAAKLGVRTGATSSADPAASVGTTGVPPRHPEDKATAGEKLSRYDVLIYPTAD